MAGEGEVEERAAQILSRLSDRNGTAAAVAAPNGLTTNAADTEGPVLRACQHGKLPAYTISNRMQVADAVIAALNVLSGNVAFTRDTNDPVLRAHGGTVSPPRIHYQIIYRWPSWRI